MRKIGYLIVGQGLAGSLLARALIARGARVVVADVENRQSASKVAAGLITPIAGRKLVPTWRGKELLPFARSYYRNCETELGARFYEEKPIWRFFHSAEEAEIWNSKKEEPELAKETESLPAEIAQSTFLRSGLKGFVMKSGAHVDTRKFLKRIRQQLLQQQALVMAGVSPDELRIGSDRVEWREFSARKIIFCEGYSASANPFLSWIPFRHTKGELLTIADESLPENVVLNSRKWILPLGGGFFRAGATYNSGELSETPTAAGRKEILDGIGRILRREPKVVAHEAGIRPAVKDMRLVAGLHPGKPNVGIFNGLGSKGVLWGPYFAEQFAASLENGTALDPEIDVRRNL